MLGRTFPHDPRRRRKGDPHRKLLSTPGQVPLLSSLRKRVSLPAPAREDARERWEVWGVAPGAGRGFLAPRERQHLRRFGPARRGGGGAAAGGRSPRRAPLQLWEVAGNRDSPSRNPRSGGRAQLVAAGPARSPRNSLPQPDSSALRAAIL